MDDKTLKTQVERELDWQPGIDAADIGVTVGDGIVRLTGRVASYSQKLAVETAVKHLKGVRGYVEDLEIRLTAPAFSDEAVAERAANMLDWDVSVPADSVKVKVEKGFLTLTGEVNWQYQRTAAEAAVRSLQGVRGVANLIAVKAQVSAPDVKRRIEDALARQAEVEADKIHVTVEGGKVRLEGKVRAWFERETAERAAWAAPGVVKVEDHVAIGG